MKFSELLDEYLTLRGHMQREDYTSRNPYIMLQLDQQRIQELEQQLDEIVEGVNRAEKT